MGEWGHVACSVKHKGLHAINKHSSTNQKDSIIQGRLPFTRNAWNFWLENEMVHTIPFETFHKLKTTGLISAFFHFFVNFLIDTSTFCDISVLRLDKLQHWIFTPKISTRMDDVNGKRPSSPLQWKCTWCNRKTPPQELSSFFRLTTHGK